MAAQTNEVRRSNYFISQSPSDDEEFPYWTPADYLERKFAITNTQVWELIRSRQSVDTHTRNPALDRKLMEAVDMFGGESGNLQRTSTKRSGDITVYSLLAQRCWRDVAQHVGTGVTPRQCEERYLQLIAASKRFEEQNVENGIIKIPVRIMQQSTAVPSMPRNRARATKPLPESWIASEGPNFDSINDLVQHDMKSGQKYTAKGSHAHKRKLFTFSPFDAYEMEADDEHAREVRKLKKQYKLAKKQDLATSPVATEAPKFVKQVTEVAKVRPARKVENVNIYKKHYIADALTQAIVSPKCTADTTVPKRKYTYNKNKTYNVRRKDAVDSDIESFDSWESCDLRTDDSAFDTSSSSDYYSSDSDTEHKVSNTSNNATPTCLEGTMTGDQLLVRHVLYSIIEKIESASTNGFGPKKAPPSQAQRLSPTPPLPQPLPQPTMDTANDSCDSDLESAYSSNSSSSTTRQHNYYNSNIVYNYEFFQEQDDTYSSDTDNNSVGSLCSVSSNSTTTDYTPFIDPAIYTNKYDTTEDYGSNETAMNTTLNNTMRNKTVSVLPNSSNQSNSVADILSELVDTIVARYNTASGTSKKNTNTNTTNGLEKTVRYNAAPAPTITSSTSHQKLKNNYHSQPTTNSTSTTPAPTFALQPLPAADEALLKSLLPTRRYHKKDINWKFLALLVGRKRSEIRAYAAQWRYERRSELLNKLVMLRSQPMVKKNKRLVSEVRRPKRSANPSKIVPSKPNKVSDKKTNNSSSKNNTNVTTNPATLTLHEVPPPSLHPVFDHTLLRAFLNVPGASRVSVGTGGTSNIGETVRAEFHTEPVLHNNGDSNITSGNSSTLCANEKLDSSGNNNITSMVDVAMEVDNHTAHTIPVSNNNIAENPLGTISTTIADSTTASTSNVALEPATKELIAEVLRMNETEIDVAEILTLSRTSTNNNSSPSTTLSANHQGDQNVLQSNTTTSPLPLLPPLPSTNVLQLVGNVAPEQSAVPPPTDATDFQLVKVMLLASSCKKSWTEIRLLMNLTEKKVALLRQRFERIKLHFPKYVDEVAVKVYLQGNIRRDTTVVEAMQKQVNLSDQEQQLLQAVYLCLSGQLPIVHSYLTNPLFNQAGVLCDALCNWQWDTICTYLGWSRAQAQSKYSKLLGEYEDKYVHTTADTATATATATAIATAATVTNTPSTMTSASSNICTNAFVPTNIDFAQAASLIATHASHLCSSIGNNSYHSNDNITTVGATTTSTATTSTSTTTTTATEGAAAVAINTGSASTTTTQSASTLRPPSPLPRLPGPQFTPEKETLLMDLVARVSRKLKPLELPVLIAQNHTERTKSIVDWLGPKQWNTIAYYVGLYRHSCLNKYYTLFKSRTMAEMAKNKARPVLAQQAVSTMHVQSSSIIVNNATQVSNPCAKVVSNTMGTNSTPSVATTTAASHTLSTTIKPKVAIGNTTIKPTNPIRPSSTRHHSISYTYQGAVYTDKTYPWSGTQTVNGREILSLSCKAVSKLFWETQQTRVEHAQVLYTTILERMKRGEGLEIETKQKLRATLETHFSHAMPTNLVYFDARNRSEDDWLVRLVWVLSAPEPTATATTINNSNDNNGNSNAPASLTTSSVALHNPPTTVAFDPNNPLEAVRRILSITKWNTIAQRLTRSVHWCQDRYYLLLQAKLANSHPTVASKKLIFEYPRLVPAPVKSKANENAMFVSVLSQSQSQSQSHLEIAQASQAQALQSVLLHQQTSLHMPASTSVSNNNTGASQSATSVNPATGVKRSRKSDSAAASRKSKVATPDTNPVAVGLSTNSINTTSGTSDTWGTSGLFYSNSVHSSSAGTSSYALPSNHAFSSSHPVSNTGVSAPALDNTGLTMGIMASIPVATEDEVYSSNDSSDGIQKGVNE